VTLSGKQFGEGQLSMFTTPRELRDSVVHGDQMGSEDVHQLYERKAMDTGRAWEWGLKEGEKTGAKRSGKTYREMSEHIKKHGVEEPVWVNLRSGAKPELWDGHHRTAMQYEHDPDRLMPVEYGGDWV
jgi:hypothetical protein